jgi:hypothetical protein
MLNDEIKKNQLEKRSNLIKWFESIRVNHEIHRKKIENKLWSFTWHRSHIEGWN